MQPMTVNSINHGLAGLSAIDAARRLIGCELVRLVDGQAVGGVIVETEAYDQTDRASHSFKGMTPRNSVMFAASGLAYVYLSYGLHYCINVVVGEPGEGAAVLIRALEPIYGLDIMANYRKTNDMSALCSGPAKLTQALKIDLSFNGHDLSEPPLTLHLQPPVDNDKLICCQRIGIRELPGLELNWRVCMKDSAFLSRPPLK